MNKLHQAYLLRALALAEQGRGFCAPNPAVGAVLVKNGQIIGEGFHRGPGLPHAEIEAIDKSRTSVKDAVLYVTLEPCCHWGKTPPCTERIIREGIQTVYYGILDCNPLVAGKGAAMLKQHGIKCEQITLPKVHNFYSSYYHWQQTGQPEVTAKIALSLDGKAAGLSGKRLILTGEKAALFTHQKRRRSDAILTTAQTILKDNPQLNARLPESIASKKVYIIDSSLTLIRLFQKQTFHIQTTAQHLFFFHDSKLPSPSNTSQYTFYPITLKNNLLSWQEMLEQIGKDGIHDLWVEAGPTCFNTLVASGYAKRAYCYIAPKIIGEKSQSAFDIISAEMFKSAKKISWRSLGKDGLCEVVFKDIT